MKNKVKWNEIQDKHLDTMIRLTFQQVESQEVQQIIESCEDVSATDDRFEPETAYARFLEKLASEERQLKKRRAEQRRRWTQRLIEIAACLVLIIGVTAPIALANIDVLRSKVLEALILVQERSIQIGMVEDVSEAFYVPNDWNGQYYPTYIPDGYELKRIGEWSGYLVFKNEKGQKITFEECSESTAVSVDTKNAIVNHDTIRGHKAMFVEKDGLTTLIWWTEDRYFIINSHEVRSEVIRMAENVKKIMK